MSLLTPAASETWITATARLSRHLRRQSDEEQRRLGQLAWESSDILPYAAWLVRCWGECAYRDPLATPILLSSAQEQVLWEQAIGSGDFSLAEFPLLDLPATASAAMQAWDLMHTWELHPDADSCRGEADAEAFLRWTQTVERTLRRNDWITHAELPNAICERLKSGVLRVGARVFYAGSGIEECTPAQRRCFEALRKSGCAVDEMATPVIGPVQSGRAGFPSVADEIQQAAAWARSKLEQAPGARIGVAVRGLAAVCTMTERVFDDAMHPGLEFVRPFERRAFHVAATGRAIDSPLIQAGFLTLRLVRGLPFPEFGMLLRSPFITLDRTRVAALETNLRRQGTDEVSVQLPKVREAFPALAAMAGRLPNQQQPGQWSATFSKLLGAAGWPGERTLSDEEASAVEQWKDLLSDLAALDLVLGLVSFAEALTRLRGIAAQCQLARNDTDAPIQILDLQEAVGLRFDAFWIAGLHGSVWPAPPRPTPFLPLALQRAAGTPHGSPERELAYARQLTEGLFAAASEVVVSYPLAAGEETLRPSPLIDSLTDVTSTFPDISFLVQPAVLEVLPGTAPVPLPEGTLQHGGMSVLADQAACPFQAFARHRLGASDIDELVFGISASEKGNVAHQAMDLLWQDLRSQDNLNARTDEELGVLIAQCVHRALEGKLSHRPVSTSMEGFRNLEQFRLEGVLAGWLAEEKKRPSFVVVERESSHHVLAGGLQLQVKADRVDEYADGSYAIIDYKTASTLSTQMWEGERPDAPQLPLYAVKSGRQVSDVFFAKLVPGDICRIGYDGLKLAERLPEWERVIDRLGSEFREGAAAVDPKRPGTTCQQCGLGSLCRVGELRPAEPEIGEGDE